MTRPTEMKRELNPVLTPMLRFPEFLDKLGWDETRLSGVLTEHGEKNDGASEVHSVSVHKGVINQVEHLGRSYAAADRSNYNLAKPYDIIYTKSPTGDFPWGVVKQNRLPYNVIVSPLYGVFSPLNRYLGYILDAYFESPIRTTNYLAPITQKGAKNTIQISNTTFISKGLYLPKLEAEQKKIAEFLSSLDELIASEHRKLDILEAHKKGLMQQLFPLDGETKPRLRFPEFRRTEDWKLTTIGALGSFYYGKSAPKWSLAEDAPTPCVRYGELYTKFGPIITETYSKTNTNPEALRFSKGGEVLIPRVGEKPEDFGKCCCYLPLKDIAIGEMISVFETKQDPLFYTYYFRNLYKQFAKVVEGQNVKNLYYTELEPLPIHRPPLPEQQKIAGCLSALDGLTSSQIDRLTLLKTHKKGLMQQLFPSLAEVNA